jgi:peroxiredoxin/tetratricopeptide (TPR) repeat protein
MRHLLLVLLLCVIPRTAGQAAPVTDAYSDRHGPTTGAGGPLMHGEAFDEGPRQRAIKLQGMGDVQFPITTRSPEAQAFFNQGIAQIHTYYYFEAERSFREAARLDPECGMAYWGMALANTNNHERAVVFLEQAEARRKQMSEREQKYLDALASRYKEGSDDDRQQRDYVRGLEGITFAYPDDIEAKALLAGALVHRNPLSRLTVDLLIEQVIQKQPLHPGAHHYRIHLWDGHEAKQALASAQRYAQAAPGIAHAWHMPGHIYNGLGRWREASDQQAASARVDHAHLARTGLLPFQIHNYAHNQHYLVANLSHLGRVRDAVAFSRNLVETPRDPERNAPTQGWSAQRLGRASLMRIYARYERWDDLLTDPLLDWSDAPMEQAWKAYSRGLAYLGKGDLERARAEAKALDKIAADAGSAKPAAEGAELMEVARLELRGRLAVAEGKLIEGFDLLTRGAGQVGRRDEDLSGYPRPYHEALGQAHLKAGNWGLAEACFRQVLEKRPNTLVSLAGLVEACARAGKRAETEAAWREFETAWALADVDLPLRERLMAVVKREATVVSEAAGRRVPDGGVGGTGAAGTGELPAAPREARPRTDDSLGPMLWAPAVAAPFRLLDAGGKWHALDGYRGRSLIVTFYLGGDCEHCMEQLKALGKEKAAIEALGATILAVSGDTPARNRKLLAGGGEKELPLLLSDPDRGVARRYGAWDEFEERPVHATFLIDPDGKVRWHRISSNPFRDIAFLKTELARVGRLAERASKDRSAKK